MDLRLRVLKESNKSRFDSCSVGNSVLIISHITFRDCRLHISRNSCRRSVGRLQRWLKVNKSSFINISDGVINSDEVDPADENESDEEHDLDVTDAKSEEEPMEQEYEDHSFLKSMMESFVEKVSFLKSRAGRAGLVHNFLRGLQIMTAPIPSGTSTSYIDTLPYLGIFVYPCSHAMLIENCLIQITHHSTR